jgi:hypothetical protein
MAERKKRSGNPFRDAAVKVTVTFDASVFVNAFSPTEEGSDQSLEFITKLRNEGIPIIQLDRLPKILSVRAP